MLRSGKSHAAWLTRCSIFPAAQVGATAALLSFNAQDGSNREGEGQEGQQQGQGQPGQQQQPQLTSEQLAAISAASQGDPAVHQMLMEAAAAELAQNVAGAAGGDPGNLNLEMLMSSEIMEAAAAAAAAAVGSEAAAAAMASSMMVMPPSRSSAPSTSVGWEQEAGDDGNLRYTPTGECIVHSSASSSFLQN